MDFANLTAIASIVGFLISSATAYLRLFVGAKLAEHERNMHAHLAEHYHSRAVVDLRFENLDSRVSRLESMADS